MKQTSSTYQDYPYFIPRLANSPGGQEWQCRNRRTALFANTTGLSAVKTQTKLVGADIENIKRHMHFGPRQINRQSSPLKTGSANAQTLLG